jgi:hydroxyacylglutathione hydrolase
MIIESRAVGPFYKNGYVLGCATSREGVIIDPGDEVDQLIDLVTKHRLSIKYILLTHAHVDHVTGVGHAKAKYAVPIGLHRDDLFLYERAPEIAPMFGLSVETLPPVDFYFDSIGPWQFGAYDVHVHHTPGHCPGGVCLQVSERGSAGKDLFVGDTLFAGSIGRTDLPGGDYDTLLRSIRDVLFRFGDDAIVYSGHGPQTTIGQERRTNPFLRGM